ncbi:hypothetical protein V1478_010967 [Vespula squamosa]|uniref:Uncharacterized protein n=1 Tax=Vespula squamosa TaxID=30214 RepID=A0ABD2AG42_VESSQ
MKRKENGKNFTTLGLVGPCLLIGHRQYSIRDTRPFLIELNRKDRRLYVENVMAYPAEYEALGCGPLSELLFQNFAELSARTSVLNGEICIADVGRSCYPEEEFTPLADNVEIRILDYAGNAYFRVESLLFGNSRECSSAIKSPTRGFRFCSKRQLFDHVDHTDFRVESPLTRESPDAATSTCATRISLSRRPFTKVTLTSFVLSIPSSSDAFSENLCGSTGRPFNSHDGNELARRHLLL